MERMTCVNYILNDADALPEVFGSAKEISKGIRYFLDFMMQWHQSLQTFRMMHSL